jgi:hypothetical protein
MGETHKTGPSAPAGCWRRTLLHLVYLPLPQALHSLCFALLSPPNNQSKRKRKRRASYATLWDLAKSFHCSSNDFLISGLRNEQISEDKYGCVGL